MNVLSIGQLNTLIGRTLDREYLLKGFYLQGTISNAKRHSAGHYYFSLKDEDASIDAVIWASTVQQKDLAQQIQNGLLVTVKGSINFWAKAGRLNIVVTDMQVGDKSPLQLEFEALKKELTALGYFDEAHKQPIPELSSCIGLVTSSSGAVLHDILHVSKQRNSLVQFKLFSVPVQGDKAGPLIAKGIERADQDPQVDLIIVGRGGGSAEDLWPFNTRPVVEAIYRAKTPIISAVGHETDYSLSDFVADQRGATPSHAAELAVLPLQVLQERVQQKEDYLHAFVSQTLKGHKQSLAAIFNRSLGMPALQLIHKQRSLLQEQGNQLERLSWHHMQVAKHELALLGQELEGANPMHMMLKGYAKVEVEGKPLTSVDHVKEEDLLHISLADGSLQALVKEVKHGR